MQLQRWSSNLEGFLKIKVKTGGRKNKQNPNTQTNAAWLHREIKCDKCLWCIEQERRNDKRKIKESLVP